MALKMKDEVTLNQQVEELRERIRILQNDRKSNIDVLEANKNSNKDDIKRLRDDNKDLRQKLAQLQRTTGMEDAKDEQAHLEREVERLRKINDDMKNKSKRLRKELDTMRDSVKDLELDSQRPHMEDNEYTRRIRALENKLDKAMIKYNEAQSIRKTYEQIVRRLTEERVGFDNQLAAIERTLGAKQKDYEELLLLSGDANHARETALGELERVRAGYEEERKKREKELRERHQMVQLRRQMLERMKYRERMRHQLANGAKPDSPAQREAHNQSMKNLQQQKIESRNKVDIFENAFRKIKEATGVSDVNEVIQKIVSQESTTENLIAVTRENQGKIEALNQLRKQIKTHCEEIKYSGVGGGQHRKVVDSFEDQLSNSATRLERSRLKYERLSKVIISMKAGIGHLQDKLESFREEIKGNTYSVTDDTVTEVLRECELCFVQLSKRIKAGDDEARRAQIADGDGGDRGGSAAGTARSGGAFAAAATQQLARSHMMGSVANLMPPELDETASRMNTLRPYNQRIDLTGNRDEHHNPAGVYAAHDPNGGGDDNSIGDLEDDELTRDKVKRASAQILAAMDKKKKRPKKKTGGGGGLAAVGEGDEQSVGSRPK